MRNIIFMHTVHDDSVLGTLRFVSKSDEFQVYGALLPEGMTNQHMRDSPTYKPYLAFATRAATPKKARKFKKPASPSKKKTLVAVEEPAEKPTKKPTTRRQSTGVQILDSDDDNDDDDQQSDNERTKFDDDDKDVNLNKTEDEEEDEFIYTPNDYVPTDEEDVDDEEFDRINKEMYTDVNVELKYSEHESEGKVNEEMTDVGQVDAEHENVSQELSDVENEVKTLRNVDHSSAIRAAVKSKIPTVVKEHLETSLDDAL
ncbi:hypothetical protein Tco_0681853 [Tanacetum coccineum]|uniref:Uncharacterized protein n=1 Tax=Tanacetum coccineum TaxID=301880 RepID=A0ABQ4XPS6_9ASTR